MEKDSVLAIPVAGTVFWSCKRKTDHCDWEGGASGSSATTTTLAKPWVKLQIRGASCEDISGVREAECAEDGRGGESTLLRAMRLSDEATKRVEEGLPPILS